MSQQHSISKRKFLQSIGALAGADVFHRTLQAMGLMAIGSAHAAPLELPRGAGEGKTVVILGAGISGMAAAYELSKAGFRCTILEATARAGGRNFTARSGVVLEETDSRQLTTFDSQRHMYANMGPARIPYHHRTILNYCKEFGVELEMFTNDNRATLFHNKERFGGKPVTSRQVITDMRGYISEMLAKSVNADTLDLPLTSEEKENVLTMLRRYGGLNPDYLYKGSNRGGYKGTTLNAGLTGKGEAVGPLDFGELMKADFWRYKMNYEQFLNSNPTLFQPIGGMDAIAHAFEQRVSPLIQYQSEVREIRKTENGVRIAFTKDNANREIQADYAISTIPAPVVKDIPNDFSPEVQATFEEMTFVPAVKIAFQAKRRFWEDDLAIYAGISWTDQDITQIWYPANGYHQHKGVILGAYIWDDEPCQRFTDMSLSDRLKNAIAEGEQLHAGYGAELEAGVSRAWSKVPFQKGGWPESEHKSPEVLHEPDGAIYFAGDQITALPGWQEGAVIAAQKVAKEITERVAQA